MTEFHQSKLEYFFDILDENANNVLQPNDFIAVANKLSDKLNYGEKSRVRHKLTLQASKLFVQILTDLEKEDENLSRKEWLSFFQFYGFENPTYIKAYIERIVNYIFSLFDRNFDKYINREEFTEMFRTYDLDREFETIAFDRLDQNKDDFISKEELVAGFCDFFLSSNPEAPGNWIFGNWNASPKRG